MIAGFDLLSLLLFFVIGIVSPFLVDLITKRFATTKWKTLTLLALNVLTGLVVAFSTARSAGVIFDWQAGLLAAAATYISGAASVAHLRPLDVIGSAGPLASLKGSGGIGKVDPAKIQAAIPIPAGATEAPRIAVEAPQSLVQAPVAVPSTITPDAPVKPAKSATP